jgi:hypothetical protein
MGQDGDSNAKKVLEDVRAAFFADRVDADLLDGVYEREHNQQFEDKRGPIRAELRDLIIEAVGDGDAAGDVS